MPRIHDITLPLRTGLPGWPGDVPYMFRESLKQVDGASVNVGAFETSVHAGTHADAPFHVDTDGATIEKLPLDIFIGPAVLLDVSGIVIIEVVDLERAAVKLNRSLRDLLHDAPRLLLRTNSWIDRSKFPDRIATLSPHAAASLEAFGVVLLGVDVPSVDPLDSKALAVHHALNRARITIVENLLLDAILPGVYELIALPLKIVGGDGAPVRAVLMERGTMAR